MTAKIDKVKLGEVEELLRELEAQFYRNTMQTKTMLMEQLLSTKLDQHPGLDAYITAMETQTKKLIGMADNIDDLGYRFVRSSETEVELFNHPKLGSSKKGKVSKA